MNAPQSSRLCFSCAGIDLSPLMAPLPKAPEKSRGPASEYEEQLAVYIDDFVLEHARSNPHCALCNLLAVCARRSGEERTLDHKNVCIRPKLVWLAHVDPVSNSDQGARLCRTGQLHVWFHEFKHYHKQRRPRLPPSSAESASASSSNSQTPDQADSLASTGSDPEGRGATNVTTSGRRAFRKLLFRKQRMYTPCLTVKSAVASWMLDVVEEHREPSLCHRIPLPRHADTTMIRNWLDKCDHDHSHPSGPGILASRILHIVSRGLLRAINTSTGAIEALPSRTEFVALSYVWGRKREEDQSLKALPIPAYASTIHDAATVAKSLGFDWLWVDRICIDQSNEAEKSALIPYIKDIFAAASLTIVAASGDSAHFGMPGSLHTPRPIETPLELESRIGESTDGLLLLPAQPSFNTLLSGCVWSTRGWTFEEEVFSRRLLYVFPSEIIFSCNKGTYRESTVYDFVPEPAGSTWSDFGATPPLIAAELNMAIHGHTGNSTRLITTRQFVRAVEEYTVRDLTIEEDRLEAFAGLFAASTDPSDGIPELALLKHGHPLGFFETALTWQPAEDGVRRKSTHGKPFAPSWSWASAGSKVHFLDNGEDGNKSDWFRFGVIGDLDVVGLPPRNINILSGKLGLDFPTELISSRPWYEDIPSDAPPTYIDAVTAKNAVSPGRWTLPVLHLVTVVFEAVFRTAPEGQHSIEPIAGSQERVTGHWSMAASTFPSESQKFAIVAGNASIYIMALRQESPNNTFSRLGLSRVSWYGAAPLFSIMKQGHVRWQYIRLI